MLLGYFAKYLLEYNYLSFTNQKGLAKLLANETQQEASL